MELWLYIIYYSDFLVSNKVIVYSFVSLFESSIELGNGILCSPINTLPLCDNAIVLAQINYLKTSGDGDLRLKNNVHARVTGNIAV